jgi:hypothetical protein
MKTKKTLNAYISFGGNLFHLTLKQKGNLGHVLGFVKEKLSLEILGVIPCVSNGISQSCFDPPTPYFKPL